MAEVLATGRVAIDINRRFEDYTSMKQFFKYAKVEELRYMGSQVSTAAAAEFDHTDDTIAFIGANALIYAKSNADAAALDGATIYMDYVNSTGTIYRNVETLLDVAGGVGTETEHAIGNENILDVAASGEGTTTCTLTTYDGSVSGPDDLKGKYLVCYSGDEKGDVYEITANTIANPTALTIDPAGGAALDTGLVQIQTTPYEDFYRLRRMWTTVEAPTDNHIVLCDHNGGNLYGVIQDLQSEGCAGSRYFAPAATECHSYLGYVKCKAAYLLEADATVGGYQIAITYTPIAIGSGAASDITETFKFSETFDWQPCIKLEPCTDVIIKILKTVDADHTLVHLDSCMFEDHSLGTTK